MKKASESGARLVRQLLAFSRRQIMEMRVVDLNTILQDLGKMLDPIIGDNIQLRTVLAEHLGGVKTDVSQIEQVIMNLVINARDAMSSGGKLTVETANIDLDENYCQNQADVKPGHYVMISVSDTGCGIPPHIKDRIFEPFFTTKAVGQGTGLGLSTVYGIVKQCGGHIEVNSSPGWGTTFKVYLPRIDEPIESHATLSVSPELLKGSETVFVIEDNTSVRRFIRDALQRYGYEILEASTGENAIGMIGDHSDKMIHLLLTDVVIPGMNGRECAECMMSFHPEMKVLYMSGHAEGATVHQGVLEPGVAFLQKPFTPMLLAQKVRHVLDNSIGMVGKNQEEAKCEVLRGGGSSPSSQ
jgi:CheY-like chemotaxis protein